MPIVTVIPESSFLQIFDLVRKLRYLESHEITQGWYDKWMEIPDRTRPSGALVWDDGVYL